MVRQLPHIKLISMKLSPSDITPRLLSPRPPTSAVRVGVRDMRSGIDVLAHLKQMKTVKADRFHFLISLSINPVRAQTRSFGVPPVGGYDISAQSAEERRDEAWCSANTSTLSTCWRC